MAAYAAVVSLKQTIEHILDSSRISLVPPSSEIIRVACRQLKPLKRILERLDGSSKSKSRKKVNDLDGRIKEAVWKFEDLLESLLSHQILSQFENSGGETDLLRFSIDLQGLQRDVEHFIETVKEMQKEYTYELDNMPELEEEELGTSTNDFGEMESKMVGFSCDLKNTINDLTENWDNNPVYTFYGMPGIGKTTFVRKIFEDPVVLRCFEHRAWVTVGRKSHFDEIAQAILGQLGPSSNKIEEQGDGKVGNYLKRRLESTRCLIVLDDVWNTCVLGLLKRYLPNKDQAMIRILLTTRLPSVVTECYRQKLCKFIKWMRFLNVKESEDLLREKVFGGDCFPPQLEKAAKKIARNCEGLPLMIVTVSDLLVKAKNMEPEYWDEVAKRGSSVFMDAYNQISILLFPTYDCLPQYVKMIFIYLGAFPRGREIVVSRLTYLLTAERFTEVKNLTEIVDQSLKDFGWKYDILTARKWNIHGFKESFMVYSWWWHLFNREASKDKFIRVLNSDVDGLEQGIQGQRRLCLRSNFVFNFKSVFNSVKHGCASTARSFICFGPYQPYSMPLDVGFKLLRVLAAGNVRFYNFPIQILELVLLQYLAITYNGELPTSIFKLFSLQFLILFPHMKIRYCGAPSHLPVQIWDMQQLKHINISGRSLPRPNSSASLQKLTTLLGVSVSNCTKEVLEKIPNIKKFGIEIELTPHDGDCSSLSCIDNLSQLEHLKELMCCVVNPEVKLLNHPLLMFPSTLQRLHLKGLGYSWKCIKLIASLPNLQVLNLQCYAFRGPKWGTKKRSFMSLKYLLLEDMDLVEWQPRRGSFPKLETLIIKHCYKLRHFRWPYAAGAGRIEMVGCDHLAVTCANQLKSRNAKYHLEVIASNSHLTD